MAEKRFLQQGGAAIYIETADSVRSDAALGPKFMSAVQELAMAVGQAYQKMERVRPDEVSISFSLGVSDDGHVVIVRGTSSANFVISLNWRGAQTSLGSPIPLQQ